MAAAALLVKGVSALGNLFGIDFTFVMAVQAGLGGHFGVWSQVAIPAGSEPVRILLVVVVAIDAVQTNFGAREMQLVVEEDLSGNPWEHHPHGRVRSPRRKGCIA
jgi:hypothetical protein